MRLVESLEDEVAVQPQSTVSKVVVRDGPLRLVMFAFDAGEELTEHTATVPVVLQVLAGAVSVAAGGDQVQLLAGGWLFLEANEPHSVIADEPTKMLLTMVRTG
jgi:quercetin dioxygenase-like cupin family protein